MDGWDNRSKVVAEDALNFYLLENDLIENQQDPPGLIITSFFPSKDKQTSPCNTPSSH